MMGAPIVGTVEPERFRTPSVRKRLPYVGHSCAKTRRYENPSAKPHPFSIFSKTLVSISRRSGIKWAISITFKRKRWSLDDKQAGTREAPIGRYNRAFEYDTIRTPIVKLFR